MNACSKDGNGSFMSTCSNQPCPGKGPACDNKFVTGCQNAKFFDSSGSPLRVYHNFCGKSCKYGAGLPHSIRCINIGCNKAKTASNNVCRTCGGGGSGSGGGGSGGGGGGGVSGGSGGGGAGGGGAGGGGAGGGGSGGGGGGGVSGVSGGIGVSSSSGGTGGRPQYRSVASGHGGTRASTGGSGGGARNFFQNLFNPIAGAGAGLATGVSRGGAFEYPASTLNLQRGVIAFWNDTTCPLTQWSPHQIIENGETFITAEHYMMAAKARFAGDERTRSIMLRTKEPSDVKRMGRNLSFVQAPLSSWNKVSGRYVEMGNILKFRQNQDARNYLFNTKYKILVEGSPGDKRWGCGINYKDPNIQDLSKWVGENKLGEILMKIRRHMFP